MLWVLRIALGNFCNSGDVGTVLLVSDKTRPTFSELVAFPRETRNKVKCASTSELAYVDHSGDFFFFPLLILKRRLSAWKIRKRPFFLVQGSL